MLGAQFGVSSLYPSKLTSVPEEMKWLLSNPTSFSQLTSLAIALWLCYYPPQIQTLCFYVSFQDEFLKGVRKAEGQRIDLK